MYGMNDAARHECARERGPDQRLKGVLIAEPDPLLRWSVTTYLSRWFEVFAVDSLAAASAVLDSHQVDLVLISDLIPERSRELIESRVLRGNHEAAVIYMVTSLPRSSGGGKMRCIEKPFQLSALARLLGVAAAQASGT